MGELYGTCALLAAVLFFVLLQKFESRFGKVDKELGEIKKRMDDLLKAQEKMASGPVRAKEDVTAETLDNTDILPYVTEELPDSTVTCLLYTSEKEIFYTSLYRTYERMINLSEDGKYYSAFDGKIHEDGGVPFYTDDWIWDTYRATHPLRILIEPQKELDMIRSYIRMAEQSDRRWMPTFPEAVSYTHL